MPGYLPPQGYKDPYSDAELTSRMSMLPLGTYADPNGGHDTLGFAVPGMIQEPVNALMRLLGTPEHPGTFAQGPDYGSNSDDMRTLLESFMGGNATNRVAGEGIAGLRDAGQAAYRNWRYADEPSAFPVDGSYHNTAESLFRGYGGGNPNAGVLHPTEVNGLLNQHTPGYIGDAGNANASLQMDVPGLDDWLDQNWSQFAKDQSDPYKSAVSRQKLKDSFEVIPGDLLSDTSRPSLMGTAVAGADKSASRPTFGDGIRSLLSGQPIEQVMSSRLLRERRASAENPAYVPPPAPAPPPNSFESHFNHGGNDYLAQGLLEGDTAYLNWIGSPLGDISSDYVHSLGRQGLRNWRDQFLAEHPEIKQFSGERISGARAGNYSAPDQTVSAFFSDSGSPSLMGSAFAQSGGDQSPSNHLKNYFEQPSPPVPSTDPSLNYKTERNPDIDSQLTAVARPHVDFLIQQLRQAYPDAPKQTLSSRAWQMYEKHPSDDYIELKNKLVPHTPY